MTAIREYPELIDVSPALSNGNSYLIQFGKIANERDGRPVHLRRLLLEVAFQVDTVAASMPGAVSVEMQRGVLQNLDLYAGDHHFLDSIDGEELHRLSARRRGDDPAVGSGSAIPDADATSVQRTVIINLECVDSSAPGCEKDGSIPLALLNENRGKCGLRFTVGVPKGVPGVTIDAGSVTVTAIGVFACYDELRVPTPWKMRAIESNKFADMEIPTFGRINHLEVRNWFAADGTTTIVSPDHTAWTGIDVWVGNERIADKLSAGQLAQFYSTKLRPGMDVMDPAQPDGVALITSAPHDKRTMRMSGPLRLKATSALYSGSPCAKARFLIHETGAQNAPILRTWAHILGAPPPGSKNGLTGEPRFAVAGNRGPTHPVADILDLAGYWPGMPWAVPARKARRKPVVAA